MFKKQNFSLLDDNDNVITMTTMGKMPKIDTLDAPLLISSSEGGDIVEDFSDNTDADDNEDNVQKTKFILSGRQ